jgi:tetratricopeptide (TPR) repeat protein
MYEKASQLDPKDVSLLTSLAECQMKNGKTEEAIMTYEQAIAMNPAASKEYKVLGDLYMHQKKNDSAIKAYKKYLEKNQDNAIAKLIGEDAYNQKNYADAMKYLGMVTGADANNVAFVKTYAQACYDGRDEL